MALLPALVAVSVARPSGSARADSSMTRSLTVALLTGGATGGRVTDIDVSSATVREHAKDSNARRDMLYQEPDALP